VSAVSPSPPGRPAERRRVGPLGHPRDRDDDERDRGRPTWTKDGDAAFTYADGTAPPAAEVSWLGEEYDLLGTDSKFSRMVGGEPLAIGADLSADKNLIKDVFDMGADDGDMTIHDSQAVSLTMTGPMTLAGAKEVQPGVNLVLAGDGSVSGTKTRSKPAKK